MLLSSSWKKENTFYLGIFITEAKLNGYVCSVFFYQEEGPVVAGSNSAQQVYPT